MSAIKKNYCIEITTQNPKPKSVKTAGNTVSNMETVSGCQMFHDEM